MRIVPVLLTAASVMMSAAPVAAQAAAQEPPPAVFLDCQTWSCETTHIRNEVQFVNWVRDRADADVYVLVTSQSTGGGGSSFLVTMTGQGRFAGDSVDIRFSTDQSSTQAEERDALTARIAQGLVRYAVMTSAAAHLRILSDDVQPADLSPAGPVRDPWNYWVFSVRADAELSGESREQERQFELSGSADRVTEQWIMEFDVQGSYEEQEFELSDRTIHSIQRDYEASAGVARAVARLWSAGMAVDVGTSSFANQDLYARVAGLLEYSLFPYSEFSRRRATIQYSAGIRHFDYEEITIYDRLSEQRADQQLELTVEFQQPWGSASLELSGSHYLDNFRHNNLSSFLNLNVRLLRGLSLDLNGHYERVRDQIYIAKGDATDDEVLLQRRALETGYRYGTSVGLRYTFGSIYNNIVNPRLDEGGGGR
ncbi:MAG TPA: hypothetical protein VHG09_05805 [Longimicrobiales bacterium]|nr:hypothetical protein [Longimicrobiales bacterium]